MSKSRSNSEFRQGFISLALLAGTLAVTFFPILFDGKSILPSDFIDTMTLPFSASYHPPQAFNSFVTDGYLQFYPLKYYTKEALANGTIAFWNPYILNGYPQYLDGMWTYNFVLFLPLSLAFPLILLLPLLVAGMGMYAMLRDYGVRLSIARIFAIAYMLNAMFVTNLLAHFIPASFSFAPFVILFLHRYSRSFQFKHLAFSAIFLALGFLAGNFQTIAFLAFVTICYWTAIWINESGRKREPARTPFLKPLAIVLGLGIGMSMVFILPTLELYREAISGGAFFSTSWLRSYDFGQRVLSGILSLTFFIPQLAGSIRGVTLQQAAGVFTQDFEGGIGFLPLLIAVLSTFALWKKKPEIRPFAVLMIAGLFLPICTPLFRYVYHRFLIVFILGACGAGALGFEAILANEISKKTLGKYIKAAAIALLSVTAVLAAISIARIISPGAIDEFAASRILPRLQSAVFAEGNPEWVQSRLREALDYWRLTRPEILIGIASSFLELILLWTIVKSKLMVPARLRNRYGLYSPAIASIWLITAFQLIYFARSWFPMIDTRQFPLYPETRETEVLRSLAHDSRVYFYREIDSTKQFMFIDNENIVYGIREATGYESVIPPCLYIYSALDHWRDTGLVTPRLLGKFNCEVLVRVKPLMGDSALSMQVDSPIWIYRNIESLPRAFFARSISTLPDDSTILHRLSEDLPQSRAAYFTPDQSAGHTQFSSGTKDSVRFISESSNEIELQSTSVDSSFLVLSDTYYPGWAAEYDGKDVPVLRCNYAMRAIRIPPGEHKIKFIFRPASFRIGAWASLATISLMILGFYMEKRKKRK